MGKKKMNIPQIRFKGFEGEWERNVLSNIVTQIKSYSLSRGVESNKPTNVKYIHYGDIHIGKARLLTSDLNLSFVDINMDYVPLKKGDLVLADASEDYIGIAECCVIDFDPKIDIVAGLHTIGIRPKIDQDPVFFYYNFKTDMFKKHCYRVGTGMKVFGITFNNLSKYDGCFPVKKEQTQIGDFFQKIDQVIELQQKALDTARAYKQSMLQKMFPQKGEKVPRVRFAGFSGDWIIKNIGSLVSPVKREVSKPDSPYYRLSIRSHARGTFQRLVEDPKQVAMDKLYIVKDGDLVVNITFAWEHAIAIAKKEDDGTLVSHRFPTYIIDKMNADFLGVLIAQKKFKYQLDLISPGGAGRNRVMNQKDFLRIKILLPKLDEQTAIGNFFQKLDQQIEQQVQKLATYQQLKKAMLQRMFV